ncbi:hypothetical protein V3C10_12970 [[Clostridium] symbiosum]|uniref:hypothetical protein n=1 Tax=Clostridium symbiosum TaxID=1512 RepID=UPI001D06A1AB|nr:hypothetical protein [[Clostridium] symbiosum]MCB6607424.1 hypothetical protein [[Clostridium] symbiosum]MCB6930020.1 hypothetical protein [[Clostridium] symbiosum]
MFLSFKGGCLDDEVGEVKAEEAKAGRYGCCCEFIDRHPERRPAPILHPKKNQNNQLPQAGAEWYAIHSASSVPVTICLWGRRGKKIPEGTWEFIGTYRGFSRG